MKTLKVSFIYLITAFTFLLISGCTKEESPAALGNTGGGTPAINALIGTWNAISVTQDGGANIIGLSTEKLTITATNFTRNGTGQFCDDGMESCNATGTITATATSYTTNVGGDMNTVNYTLSGNTFTIIVDGFTIVFQKE